MYSRRAMRQQNPATVVPARPEQAAICQAARMLRELAPDLWIADAPLRFLGIELGARMTVVRLPGSRLVLHSPISRSVELADQIDRLGAPAFLVAPNRFHHLYVGEWQAAYPTCRLFVAPGLDLKRPDLRVDGLLGDGPLPDGSDVLDQALVAGSPLSNEVVFFHAPSATLIATDLLFNVGARSPALTRFAFRLVGAYGRPAPTVLERLLIRDRVAFRRSLERILAWPISRVVIAHGDVVEAGGRAAIAEAYSWLLDGSRTRPA
jgi:hypothetical protein